MKTTKKNKLKKITHPKTKNEVIAYRKSCDIQGTGLTHYILMENKTR